MFLSLAAVGLISMLSSGQPVPTPVGAVDLCKKYDWVCKKQEGTNSNKEDVEFINTNVNKINPVEDIQQYGIAEYWSLPGRFGADCEDYVLEKKRRLLESGFNSENLIISVVLTKKFETHALLFWLNGDTIYVLDNLTNKIVPLKKSRYRLIWVQNPLNKNQWVYME